MKLNFDKKTMEYLRPVLRETRTVEESAEIIIPDTCPDGEGVLFTWGNACYRGKELTEESLTVAMGVSAWSMVQPEGRNTPEVVEAYIPMSLHISSAVLHNGQSCRVEVSLKRLEGMLVNPRKVMIRAVVSVSVWVYESEKEEHLSSCGEDSVEMLGRIAPVRRLVALEEKQYTVEDTVPFQAEGAVKTICGARARITHTDQRMAGSKAVWKGQAEISVTYLDREGACRTGHSSMGFSQYVDLGVYMEEGELHLLTCPGGLDVDVSGDGTELHASLRLSTCAELWCQQEISYVEDIYSLGGCVRPETEHRSYDCLLDRQVFAPAASGMPEGLTGPVIAVDCIPGSSQIRRKGEQVQFAVPVKVVVLYEGEDGRLQGQSMELELQASTLASENCRFEILMDDLRGTSAPGGLGIKVEGIMTVSTFGIMEFSEILGGELTETEESTDGPGIVIRRCGQQDSLWNMAKTHRTTREAIMGANGLDGEPLPGRMLLIPRGN